MLNEQILFFGRPISFSKDAILHQPTLRELMDKGLIFEELIEPFITLDKGHFQSEQDNDKLLDFDFFFIQIFMAYIEFLEQQKQDVSLKDWLESSLSDGLVIKRLIKTLKFLFQTNDISLNISEGIVNNLEEDFITINKSYKIDRDTYPILKEVICEIFDTEIKIEKKPEKSKEEQELDALFEKRRREYEKKYGKKKKKDDVITIFTLVNYIIHNKFSNYNYNSIQDLTIYQIKNTFKYYQSLEVYDIDIAYRTSGQFKMDKQNKHWFFDNK